MVDNEQVIIRISATDLIAASRLKKMKAITTEMVTRIRKQRGAQGGRKNKRQKRERTRNVGSSACESRLATHSEGRLPEVSEYVLGLTHCIGPRHLESLLLTAWSPECPKAMTKPLWQQLGLGKCSLRPVAFASMTQH